MPRKIPAIDAVIVGAGPVGLLIANYLGAQGVQVVVLEQLPKLIDYPRGVGMDDECLRAFQAAGLVDDVLPHVLPNQWMKFTDGKGREFASIEPRTRDFGWPRRNGFIQPLVDQVLAQGLDRYPNVQLLFGRHVSSLSQDEDGVTLEIQQGETGEPTSLRARYVVAANGGNSSIRRALNIPFEGTTDPNRWVVIDVANDPIGTPSTYLHCRPPRPFVSIALPHGVRRFEFMLHDGEAPGDEVSPQLLAEMLAKVLPRPDDIDLVRARVYTHNARLARRFRQGRVLLAGDAAHIMPVWQGQGYNSGIRDAANLGWKLGLVLRGLARDALLDTYEAERREHARAMINLSETAGKIFSPTNPLVVAVRDTVVHALGAIPAVKRYFLEMRFKPIPRYREGALHYGRGFDKASPVGRMFLQPRVETDAGVAKLDDVLGPGFALIAWGGDPSRWLTPASREVVKRLGIKLFWACPSAQRLYESERCDVAVIGDVDETLKEWFAVRDESVVLLRPDRFVGACCGPQAIDATLLAFADALSLVPPVSVASDKAPRRSTRPAAVAAS